MRSDSRPAARRADGRVRGGRPRSQRAASARVVRIKLRLYPGEDDDLIAFFANVPKGLRATMVKMALRSGVEGRVETVEDEDMTDALGSFVG